MINYELGRLLQAEREREIARRLRTTELKADRVSARRRGLGIRHRLAALRQPVTPATVSGRPSVPAPQGAAS